MRNWADLRDWACQNGAVVDERLEPNGYGGMMLRACSRVSGDSIVLVEVPRSLWIEGTEETFSGCSENLDAGILALASKLAKERAKGDGSFWRHYIASLPLEPSSLLDLSTTDCQQLPLGVSEAAINLRGCASQALALMQGQEYAQWALVCVWSRAFKVDIKDEGLQVAMVPLADAFNHSDELGELSTCKGFDGYDFYVATDGPVDQEAVDINICYRPGATNARLLLQYGFCLLENRHAEVAMQLDPFRIVFLTSEAEGVLAHDIALRLDESADDWISATLDQDCVNQLSRREVDGWIDVLDKLVTAGLAQEREHALRLLRDAMREAESSLLPDFDDHSDDIRETMSLRKAVFNLCECSRLLLRLARGRLPLLDYFSS